VLTGKGRTVALLCDLIEERVAPVPEGGGGHHRRRREGGVLGRGRESMEGGGEAPMVLRPFYRQWSCGDGEGKWGVVRGTTRQCEAGEGGLVLIGGWHHDRQRLGRGTRGQPGGCPNRGV
jgi:hypothetical protein